MGSLDGIFKGLDGFSGRSGSSIRKRAGTTVEGLSERDLDFLSDSGIFFCEPSRECPDSSVPRELANVAGYSDSIFRNVVYSMNSEFDY